MGGVGSGRHWHDGAKHATAAYRSIDVRRWHRDGLLAPYRFFSWDWSCNGKMVASIQARAELDCVILTYSCRISGENWRKESYPVYVDRTPCNFGGERLWFLCPVGGCGRRVAILYGHRIFSCRKCIRLAYASQRESSYDRASRRADKIRAKLGWKIGFLNGAGSKPKGMHWKTFERLTAEHDAFAAQSWAEVAAEFDELGESLSDWM